MTQELNQAAVIAIAGKHLGKVGGEGYKDTYDPSLLVEIPRYLNNNECKEIGTYPLDYNFKSIEPKYLIGMSVPPVMTAQIANQIKIQWLDKL